MLAQKDAEIERLKKYADAIHADKMDALLEIERLRDERDDLARMVNRVAELEAALAKTEDKP
jgi:hypothetical protein